MTALACAFIIHAGFTQIGRLAIPVFISGPKPVHACALRLIPCAALVLHRVGHPSQRQVGYMSHRHFTWLNLSFNKDGQAWPDAPIVYNELRLHIK